MLSLVLLTYLTNLEVALTGADKHPTTDKLFERKIFSVTGVRHLVSFQYLQSSGKIGRNLGGIWNSILMIMINGINLLICAGVTKGVRRN